MRITFQSFLLVSSLLLTHASCKHTNETNISAHFDTESHNMGKNCMNCHAVGEEGEGWFSVAGTVYDSMGNNRIPNGTVRLYTTSDSSGILRATLEVDGNGNFYTTEAVDFSGGLYPEVTGTSEDVRRMLTAAPHGQCNSCHDGSNERRIWVK